MDKSHRLFRFLASASLALLSSTVAFAAPSTPSSSKLQLIVWAHTNMDNQGAPTLDILDLERYFVSRLEGRIENILPSQSARSFTSPNSYVAELLVDTITPSVRAVKDEATGNFKEDPIFHVELSLAVKEPGSGRILGFVRESQDYHFNQSDLERLEPKRAALYESVDNLADHFADKIAKGEFGEQLRSVTRAIIPIGAVVFLALTVGMGVLAFSVMSQDRKKTAAPTPAPGASPAPRARPKPSPKLDELSAERVNTAIALWLATDNFSHAKVWEAAHDAHDEILEKAAAIQREEARRRLNVKYYEAVYARIADIAVARSSFSRDELIVIMRKTDEWDYRVLCEAELQLQRGCRNDKKT